MKNDASFLRLEVHQGVADHMGVEMTTLAGVDLNRLGAGGADAVGVVLGSAGRPR